MDKIKIGIIGLGVVGSAVKYGFEKMGHHVFSHDLKLKTSILDVLTADAVYICVPTPSADNGACDTSIVEDTINQLTENNYGGVIIIKSTVRPGFTESMIKKYSNDRICFCPEFLRERAAVSDFQNMDVLIVGTDRDDVYTQIVMQHGKYPRSTVRLRPTEAELAKYFNNCYNATLVTFANSFYEISVALNADYMAVKNAIVKRDHIADIYLDCNENFRGFGGHCLPKDTAAIANLCDTRNVNVEFFKMLLNENSKYKTTVFEGMRK